METTKATVESVLGTEDHAGFDVVDGSGEFFEVVLGERWGRL